MRLSRCSTIMLRMFDKLVSAQVNMVCVARTTPGSFSMFLTTRSTSTTEAMFRPQWQMKTPMRGSSSVTSCSSGYVFFTVRVWRAEANSSIAMEAAPLACITVSGMSFGSWNARRRTRPVGRWTGATSAVSHRSRIR